MANPYDYFAVLASTASLATEAAHLLDHGVRRFFDGSMADVWRHISEVLEESQKKESLFLMQLQRSFMTPIGRSDLYAAFQSSGAMICALEKAASAFYCCRINSMQKCTRRLSQKIVFCCEAVENLMGAFAKRKQEELFWQKRELLLSSLSDGKREYVACMRENFLSAEGMTAVRWKWIYDEMYACIQACNVAGDLLTVACLNNI